MNKHTSVQAKLPAFEDANGAQSEMFAEFGTAPGAGGTKPGLIKPEQVPVKVPENQIPLVP